MRILVAVLVLLMASPVTVAADAAPAAASPHRSAPKLPKLVHGGGDPTDASHQVSSPATVDPPFNGLDETFSGGQVNGVPSDTILAANATKVLQAVNRSIRLSSTAGATIHTMSLQQFFGASASNGKIFDPKVYFDRNAVNQRFYVIAIQNNGDQNGDPADDFSSIHLSISRSSNPANLNPANWCRYELEGLFTSPATNNVQSFPDFPGLGVGADALVISTRQDTGLVFGVSLIRPLDKLVYSNNANSCPLDPYWEIEASSTFNDFSAMVLQPAQHYTNPTSFPGRTNPAYLVSARHGGASSTYRVWRLSNVAPVSLISPPPLEVVNVSWATYSQAPSAPGGAGGAKVDVGDVDIRQTAGVGDAISAVHTIACQFTANTAFESCFRMVRFIVGQTNGTMTVTKSELQGLGGGDNAFYYHPGIAVNNSHQTVVVFLANLPGNAHRISSRVATKALGAGFGVSMPLTNGTCARAPFSPGSEVSTGDYTGAQTAVDGTAFWVAAEHADLIGGVCQWKTRIARVTHP